MWAAISAARKGARVALVEKGATIRSGQGGLGCDHWCDTPANPLSRVDPDEWAQRLVDNQGGYACGIGRQIHNAGKASIRFWKWRRWAARSGIPVMSTQVLKVEMKKPD